MLSKERFHLLGGGVRALPALASERGGQGEASLVGGWLPFKLGEGEVISALPRLVGGKTPATAAAAAATAAAGRWAPGLVSASSPLGWRKKCSAGKGGLTSCCWLWALAGECGRLGKAGVSSAHTCSAAGGGGAITSRGVSTLSRPLILKALAVCKSVGKRS